MNALVRAPALLPADARGAPWWERLSTDFAFVEEPFTLAFRDRLRVVPSATFDHALRLFAASLVGGLAMPGGFGPIDLYRELRASSPYEGAAARGDPRLVFTAPAAGVDVRARTSWLHLFRAPDGVCEDLSFESPFVPLHPALRDAYVADTQNRVASARFFRHERGPRPVVVAIHGFSADLYHANEWLFAIPWFYKAGFDVLLVTLPFHGSRKRRRAPFSGHGFFAHGPSWINEALLQSVFDTRIFVDHLLARGATCVGITGMSLGGLVTALLACAEPRLAFAIPNVPVVSLADLAMEWQPIAAYLKTALAISRRSLVDARRWLAITSPLTYAPALDRDRLMIIGGVGDRLAPPKQARLLWEHWRKPEMHWFPGSHVLHLDRGEYFLRIERFLQRLGVTPLR